MNIWTFGIVLDYDWLGTVKLELEKGRKMLIRQINKKIGRAFNEVPYPMTWGLIFL